MVRCVYHPQGVYYLTHNYNTVLYMLRRVYVKEASRGNLRVDFFSNSTRLVLIFPIFGLALCTTSCKLSNWLWRSSIFLLVNKCFCNWRFANWFYRKIVHGSCLCCYTISGTGKLALTLLAAGADARDLAGAAFSFWAPLPLLQLCWLMSCF